MGPNLELTGRYPSVSAFLGAAESDQTKLFNWQSKQIQEMGYSGFKSYMGKRTKSGTNFHNTIKNLLDGFKKSGKLTDEACRDAVEVGHLNSFYIFLCCTTWCRLTALPLFLYCKFF